MADQVELDPGSGGALVYVDELTVATSTVAAQRVKLLLGADGENDGDVHSSNPLPVVLTSTAVTQPVSGTITADIGTVSSLATQATLAQVSTFTNSTNTLLVQVSSNTASTNALLSTQTLRLNNISTFTNSTNTILGQVLSSQTLRITLAASDVALGGGTQYVEGDTSTAPTGTVMMWKSAVSTLVPVTSSEGLPVNVIAGSLAANTEYVEGDTSTAPTGIVMLWKSAVSTLQAASTSNPLPITGLGTLSSVASQLTLGNVSTFTNSTNTLLIQVSSNTASTNALLSTQTVALGNISTFTNSTNTLAIQLSTGTFSTVSLNSSQLLRLNTISTHTNSTNTLLVNLSSNTASTNSLASTIALRLAPAPTGIYVQPVAVSSNGLSVFRTLDTDETEEQVSATPCTVYGIWVTNTSTTAAYLKLYNGTSSAIAVGTDTPLITFGVPGSSTQALTGANLNAGGLGINFSTACCIAATLVATDADTTAVGASSVICNVFYKN